MPITLNDYASLIQDEFTRGLFMDMRRMNDILKIFPIVEVGAPKVTGAKWDTLPEHSFRKINADFSASTGTLKVAEDELAIFGGTFNEDEAFQQFKKANLYRKPTEQQFTMHSKAMERGLMNYVVNGDSDSDPDEFDGLWARLNDTTYLSADQLISASDNSGTELLVLASAGNAQQFFDALDEAIYQIGLWGSPAMGQPAGALLMNKKSRLGMVKAAKETGWSIDTVDMLGWRMHEYGGLPMLDVGLQRDQSTEIILNTYTGEDGEADTSRIYVVRFTEPDDDIESTGSDGLHLIQAGGLRRLGPIPTITSFEHGLEWILGVCTIGDSYCVSCVNDFDFAAS